MDYWADPGDSMAVLGLSPTTAPDSPPRRRSKSATTPCPTSTSRGSATTRPSEYWKLACILQGVYARYVAGAGAGDQGSVEGFPLQIGRLFEMAANALETAP